MKKYLESALFGSINILIAEKATTSYSLPP